MARTITLAERNAAETFLKALGATATGPMIAAVVAWMNKESGSLSKVLGNNPFNLRPGVVSGLSSGLRRIGTDPRTGEPQYVLKFASLTKGLQAAAYYLTHLAQYKNAVLAARRGDVVGFLASIGALYSSKYGYEALYKEYKTFTAIANPPVPQPTQQTQPTQPAPVWKLKFPRQYKQLRPLGRDDSSTYIDGYEVQRFYAARQRSFEKDLVS